MDKKLQIKIAIDANTGELQLLNSKFDDLTKTVGAAAKKTESFQDRIKTMGHWAAGLYLVNKAIDTIRWSIDSAVNGGIRLNREFEAMEMGISALYTANTRGADAMTRFAYSQSLAAETVNQLRVANLSTAATLGQLTGIYQQAIGASMSNAEAMGGTVDAVIENTIRLSQRMSNIAASIGMPMEQVGEEIRSLMEGTIDVNARISKMLGITNADINRAKDETNGLLRLFDEKLGSFDILVNVDSFDKAYSNMADKIDTLRKDSMEPISEDLQSMFNQTASFLDKYGDTIAAFFRGAYIGGKRVLGNTSGATRLLNEQETLERIFELQKNINRIQDTRRGGALLPEYKKELKEVKAHYQELIGLNDRLFDIDPFSGKAKVSLKEYNQVIEKIANTPVEIIPEINKQRLYELLSKYMTKAVDIDITPKLSQNSLKWIEKYSRETDKVKKLTEEIAKMQKEIAGYKLANPEDVETIAKAEKALANAKKALAEEHEQVNKKNRLQEAKAQRELEASLKAQSDAYMEIAHVGMDEYEKKMHAIYLQTQAWIDTGVDVNTALQAQEELLTELEINEIEKDFEGLTEAEEKQEKQLVSLTKATENYFETLLDGFDKALSNQFFDVMSGKFDNAGNFLQDFTDSLQTSVLRSGANVLGTSATDLLRANAYSLGLISVPTFSNGDDAKRWLEKNSGMFNEGGYAQAAEKINSGDYNSISSLISTGSNLNTIYGMASNGLVSLGNPLISAGNATGITTLGELGGGYQLWASGSALPTGTNTAFSAGYYGGGALLGGIGGYALGSLGDSLFGTKTQAGTYGALGGASGALIGAQFGSVGGPLGALIGAGIGSALGGMFGSSSTQNYSGGGVFINPLGTYGGHTQGVDFYVDQASGGYGSTSSENPFLYGSGINWSTSETRSSNWYGGSVSSSGSVSMSGIDARQFNAIREGIMAIDDAFEQLFDDDTWNFTVNGGYHGSLQGFVNSIPKMVIEGVMPDADSAEINQVFTAWKKYADELGSTVAEAMLSQVAELQAKIQSINVLALQLEGDDVGAIRLQAQYAEDLVDTLSGQLDTYGVSLETFSERMEASLANDFTPEAVDLWEQLGDAVMNAATLTEQLVAAEEAMLQQRINEITVDSQWNEYMLQLDAQIITELASVTSETESTIKAFSDLAESLYSLANTGQSTIDSFYTAGTDSAGTLSFYQQRYSDLQTEYESYFDDDGILKNPDSYADLENTYNALNTVAATLKTSIETVYGGTDTAQTMYDSVLSTLLDNQTLLYDNSQAIDVNIVGGVIDSIVDAVGIESMGELLGYSSDQLSQLEDAAADGEVTIDELNNISSLSADQYRELANLYETSLETEGKVSTDNTLSQLSTAISTWADAINGQLGVSDGLTLDSFWTDTGLMKNADIKAFINMMEIADSEELNKYIQMMANLRFADSADEYQSILDLYDVDFDRLLSAFDNLGLLDDSSFVDNLMGTTYGDSIREMFVNDWDKVQQYFNISDLIQFGSFDGGYIDIAGQELWTGLNEALLKQVQDFLPLLENDYVSSNYLSGASVSNFDKIYHEEEYNILIAEAEAALSRLAEGTSAYSDKKTELDSLYETQNALSMFDDLVRKHGTYISTDNYELVLDWIRQNFEWEGINGFSNGGHTGIANPFYESFLGKDAAGVVHKNEWVAPEWMNKHPDFSKDIARLEKIRQRGFVSGGYVSPVSGSSGNDDLIKEVKELRKTVAMLDAQLKTLTNVSRVSKDHLAQISTNTEAA